MQLFRGTPLCVRPKEWERVKKKPSKMYFSSSPSHDRRSSLMFHFSQLNLLLFSCYYYCCGTVLCTLLVLERVARLYYKFVRVVPNICLLTHSHTLTYVHFGYCLQRKNWFVSPRYTIPRCVSTLIHTHTNQPKIASSIYTRFFFV